MALMNTIKENIPFRGEDGFNPGLMNKLVRQFVSDCDEEYNTTKEKKKKIDQNDFNASYSLALLVV